MCTFIAQTGRLAYLRERTTGTILEQCSVHGIYHIGNMGSWQNIYRSPRVTSSTAIVTRSPRGIITLRMSEYSSTAGDTLLFNLNPK